MFKLSANVDGWIDLYVADPRHTDLAIAMPWSIKGERDRFLSVPLVNPGTNGNADIHPIMLVVDTARVRTGTDVPTLVNALNAQREVLEKISRAPDRDSAIHEAAKLKPMLQDVSAQLMTMQASSADKERSQSAGILPLAVASVALILAGTAAWYLYHSRQNTPAQDHPAATTTAMTRPETAKPAEPIADRAALERKADRADLDRKADRTDLAGLATKADVAAVDALKKDVESLSSLRAEVERLRAAVAAIPQPQPATPAAPAVDAAELQRLNDTISSIQNELEALRRRAKSLENRVTSIEARQG